MPSCPHPTVAETPETLFIRKHVLAVWRLCCNLADQPEKVEGMVAEAFRFPLHSFDEGPALAEVYRRGWQAGQHEKSALAFFLAKLTPQQRVAILLQEYAELSLSGIGTALGVPRAEVEKMLSAARQNIKSALS